MPADSAPSDQSAPPRDAPTAHDAREDNGGASDAPVSSTVEVGGQTAPITEADQINAIDRAADNSSPAESTLPRDNRADMTAANTAAATTPEPSVSQVAFVAPAPAATDQNADGETIGAQNTGAQDAIAQDASDQNATAVGTASWIAQILAALGGAVTAAVVAWFLIGAGPVRRYG